MIEATDWVVRGVGVMQRSKTTDSRAKRSRFGDVRRRYP
jgi:hypothetical protein